MSKSQGTVKFFNTQKGFGFIIPDGDDKDLFFHTNSVQSNQSLNEGQRVEYVKGQGRKGPEATEVVPL